MKRLIPLLLAALLLCGCGSQSQETLPPTTEYIAPTEPAGSYLPGSETETETAGAVRVYPMDTADCYAIAAAGSDILLFSGVERTVLTLLKGENLYEAASRALDVWVHPENASFRISENGITYFDTGAQCVVFLDKELREVSRLPAPENMTGEPILSANRMKLYYCTADAIRVVDLETGIDRLIREIAYPTQYLKDILFHDTMLRCAVSEGKTMQSLFILTDTGELVYQQDADVFLTGRGDIYYADLPEGSMEAHLFGSGDGAPTALVPADPFAAVTYLDDIHGALTVDQIHDVLYLDYYDLHTGMRSAALELNGVNTPWCIVDEPARGGICFLADGADQTVLYRWDPKQSPSDDETVYTTARYTLENMDEAGIAACRDWAAELSETYGVELLVGMDAVRVEPWDYELYPEYQVPVIRRALGQMEQILQQYPADFFRILSDGTTEGPVKVCLVRSATGSPESGSLTQTNGIQFWDGDTAYVAVTVGNMMEQSFFHEMFHVIESRVFSNTNVYYEWDKLNPEGFTYDYNYVANLNRNGEAYLGEDRAFIDTYSMSFPKEDRARIMEYAAMTGNETYFLSDTMQNKLRTLCVGIREAFDLKDAPESFVWEQYLLKPLTE